MNVVGRVGSLISQGVYSVATPFHPFGGAVDIIVVEQEDGTYRSTPWYVRFGKFQGVLKGAEKIVRVSVNAVEANFNMFLDNSGEAYFVREVESGSKDSESNDLVRFSSDLLECTEDNNGNESKDNCQDGNEGKEDTENNELYGCHNGRASQEASVGSPVYTTYRYGSLDEVEVLVKSSQDSNSEMVLVSVDGHVLTAPISSIEENTVNVQLSTPQFHLGPGEGSGEDFGSVREDWGAGIFGGLDASTPESTKVTGCRLDTSKDVGGLLDHDQVDRRVGHMTDMSSTSEDVGEGMSRKETFMSCLELSELTLHMEDDSPKNFDSPSMALNVQYGSQQSLGNSPSSTPTVGGKEARVDPNFGDCACVSFSSTDLASADNLQIKTTEIKVSENNVVVNENAEYVISDTVSVDLESNVRQLVTGTPALSSDAPFNDGSPAIDIESGDCEKKGVIMEHVDYAGCVSIPVQPQSGLLGENDETALRSQVAGEEECSKAQITESSSSLSSLGFEISLCGNLLRPRMGQNSADEAFKTHRLSKEDFEASGPSIVKNGNLIVRYKEKYWAWDKAAPLVLGKAVFGADLSIEMKDAIPVEHEEVTKVGEDTLGISPSSSSRRWRLWPIPFRRVVTLQHSNSESSNEEVFVDTESSLQSPGAEPLMASNGNDNKPPHKQYVRTNIPTTEQIASLNLKDGQNMVAFSFSTRVLGKQQVDAHIYLWKWNARIVISDVDGTITRSDVLGQFMPLVGKDWSQSGVAGLFSAIKENGYQLLFLSARAIVQAYLTRSFLLNLKQDGKALPNGPVVISPDGLFPSLYREVIRRAPHEFKIACLEDIRALFPSDYNPFYAGFGNRDTDELSYRKIGIPKGKIFIINPKGEVAINHCIDVKSYTSLHTLVNDMFPPTSSAEQEDYNSWNYWKMPLPTLDC